MKLRKIDRVSYLLDIISGLKSIALKDLKGGLFNIKMTFLKLCNYLSVKFSNHSCFFFFNDGQIDTRPSNLLEI